MKKDNSLMKKNLALFFTKGYSLKKWHNAGILDREIAIYNRLSVSFGKVFFFTYGDKRDLKYSYFLKDNIEIVVMPRLFCGEILANLKILTYSLLMPLIHYNKLKNVDILKTNQMDGAWAALGAKFLLRKKLIIRTGYVLSKFHTQISSSKVKNKIVKLIEKVVYGFADGIISSSKDDFKYVRKNFKIRGIHILIPNYIDTSKFKPSKCKKDKDSVCFVGRLERQKNLFHLLESLIDIPVKLTIVGEGSLKDGLKEFAEKNYIDVSFLGIISNEKLPGILNKNEIFILPSIYEGMPKSLLEAMSCGRPVIGTNVDGINEIVIHGVNGLLCKTDSLSIRDTIVNLLGDNNLKIKLGINARKTIVKNYSLDEIIERELRLYKDLI